MKRELKIHIESGEQTCASSPGMFCPWLRRYDMGRKSACGLFDGQELVDAQGVPSGSDWLQRLPECLEAEQDAKGPETCHGSGSKT